MDLSFPPLFSVNANIQKDIYLETPFRLTLPTVDDIVHRIVSLGRGCHIFKVNISRAFRHIKVDPKDYKLLCLKQDKYYLDTCLHFGFRLGTVWFQHIPDVCRYLMKKNYACDVINYVEDIVAFSTVSKISQLFQNLIQMLEDLGFYTENPC